MARRGNLIVSVIGLDVLGRITLRFSLKHRNSAGTWPMLHHPLKTRHNPNLNSREFWKLHTTISSYMRQALKQTNPKLDSWSVILLVWYVIIIWLHTHIIGTYFNNIAVNCKNSSVTEQLQLNAEWKININSPIRISRTQNAKCKRQNAKFFEVHQKVEGDCMLDCNSQDQIIHIIIRKTGKLTWGKRTKKLSFNPLLSNPKGSASQGLNKYPWMVQFPLLLLKFPASIKLSVKCIQ